MHSFGEYRQVGVIGEGAFGKVFKALDKKDHMVAIKYIKFDSEEEGIPSSALREISLLKTLKEHPNIVPLIEVQYRHVEKELKIVFDYYDYDLKKYINQKDYRVEDKKIRVILKKILNGVAYIHSKRVLHRDLKPQNILVDKGGSVKLADFGLARLLMVPQNTLTHEIETLWYRAPEVLLGQENYTYAVDVWAVGCIFAELFTRKPFFLGNGYEIEQIFQIFSIMGTPTLEYWPGLKKFRDFKPTFPKWEPQDLSQFLPDLPEDGLDLLARMLALNPERRIGAAEALRHDYLRQSVVHYQAGLVRAPRCQQPGNTSPRTLRNCPGPWGWSQWQPPAWVSPLERQRVPCPSLRSAAKQPSYLIHSCSMRLSCRQSHYPSITTMFSLYSTPYPSSLLARHSPSQAILPDEQQRTPLPVISPSTHSPQYLPPSRQQKLPNPFLSPFTLYPSYLPSLSSSTTYSLCRSPCLLKEEVGGMLSKLGLAPRGVRKAGVSRSLWGGGQGLFWLLHSVAGELSYSSNTRLSLVEVRMCWVVSWGMSSWSTSSGRVLGQVGWKWWGKGGWGWSRSGLSPLQSELIIGDYSWLRILEMDSSSLLICQRSWVVGEDCSEPPIIAQSISSNSGKVIRSQEGTFNIFSRTQESWGSSTCCML